jgi:uncharacterized repeat protein (TIGR01451 family)
VVLRCPQCGMIGGHDRTAFFGQWVVCPSCERPFAWKEARVRAKGRPNASRTQTKPEEERRRRKMKALRKMIYSAAAITSIGSSPALAQTADQEQALVVSATNLMADDARHLEVERNGGDAHTLLPGDIVMFRLVFTNVTPSDVGSVEFVDPLPEGLHYVEQSATADREDVVIEYSADQGKTFSHRPLVEEIVDGERRLTPARPEQYTHIRWRVEGLVQPAARVTAEFRARLPGPDETNEAEPGN